MKFLRKNLIILLTTLLILPFTFSENTHIAKAESKSSALVLLEKFIEYSSKTTSLYSKFHQEKHVAFLDMPIKTSGTLFFEKGNPNTLFWEYEKPALSGIFIGKIPLDSTSENAKTYVWTQERTNYREAKDIEKNFTEIMAQQLIFWLNIDSQQIEKQYEIFLHAENSITLVPKETYFFRKINLVFSSDIKNLSSLTFYENEESYTHLNFIDTQYNKTYNEVFPQGIFNKSK